jgi:hypothetical protein
MPSTDPKVRAATDKRWREKNKKRLAEHQRKARLMRRYGITVEQYEEMYAKQGGACALCGTKQKVLSVDHDHTCCKSQEDRDDKTPACGKCVRGLLCVRCNTALGTLGDTPEALMKVQIYLEGGDALVIRHEER